MGEPYIFAPSYTSYINDAIFPILRKMRADGYAPNNVVCISRGGLFGGATIAKERGAAFAVIAMKSYGLNRAQKDGSDVYIERNLATNSAAFGKRVLLFDDLDESGETLRRTKEFLLHAYGHMIEDIKVAVAFRKHSAFPIDYFGLQTPCDAEGHPAWIKQPWEGTYEADSADEADLFYRDHLLTQRLGDMIEESSWRPNQIVCIATDGLLPGVLLSERFKISGSDGEEDCPLAVVTIKSHGLDKSALRNDPAANFFLDREICKNRASYGNRVLLVDAVAGTGRSLHTTLDWLRHEFGYAMGEIRTAVLQRDPGCAFVPDYVSATLVANADGRTPWIQNPHHAAAMAFRKTL